MNICPSCQKGVLSPILKSSPFLIIKEKVTQNEIASKEVFVQHGLNKYGHDDPTTSYYLDKELGKVGLQLSTMNLTNFYMHIPPKVGRSKDEQSILTRCQEYSISQVVEVAQGMKVILMMGADTIKIFTGYNASDVYGLVCKSDLLPNVPVIVPASNSDKIMNQPIGELRNALMVFAEQIKVYKQFMNMES
jgi:hypothetical protein